MKKILFLSLFLGLVGCSTTMPINYIASPVIKGEGEVSIGTFQYIPAKNGLVKPNEFQKSSAAIGSMYMPTSADALLKSSLTKELIASGFSPSENADLKIHGDIQKFLYDWIGFIEVDFYLDVDYVVMKNDQIIYKKLIKTHIAAPKAMGATDSEAVRSAISANISELLQDLKGKKII